MHVIETAEHPIVHSYLIIITLLNYVTLTAAIYSFNI